MLYSGRYLRASQITAFQNTFLHNNNRIMKILKFSLVLSIFSSAGASDNSNPKIQNTDREEDEFWRELSRMSIPSK